jgi:DNA-binding transcriptional LysR family regulator
VAVGNIDALSFTGSEGKIEVPLRVFMRYRSVGGVAHAAAAGIGLAPLPDIMFEEPTFEGVLTPILTDYPLAEPTLYVVYVSRRYLPLKIRAFIDFLMEVSARTPVRKLAAVR